MKKLELLAPAKNLVSGIAAIEHGADAVYIGAQRFGARSAAGNSVSDIRQLCDFAHAYRARVYVTVNTLLNDDELKETEQLIWELHEAGADAILTQDMALLQMSLPPIELHASTQTDNRTTDKVKWLAGLGFRRVVLARELSLETIREIHESIPDVELEVFVHGALCVSYSGLCYVSEHCFKRSANRGECAQFCRFRFDLVDANGKTIVNRRHLLSLKDMNRLEHLEELILAGATSFKIEGRLKDISYVKNVVAAYSNRLNQWIDKHPDSYCRASLGSCHYSFSPDLKKTFHRGYTPYFLHKRTSGIESFDTPKAIGAYVGKVKEIRGRSFNVAGTAVFANGDGLCYFNDKHELEGFRVNKVENNRLFPTSLPAQLKEGTQLYRNQDMAFDRLMAGRTAERKIPVVMMITAGNDSLILTISVSTAEDKLQVQVCEPFERQKAQKPQEENIRLQLGKLGDTIFECVEVRIETSLSDCFIPSSLLAKMRRQAVKRLAEKIAVRPEIPHLHPVQTASLPPLPREYDKYPSLYNITNRLAHEFYTSQGLQAGHSNLHQTPLMQCRHCIRYSLGYCMKHGGKQPQWHEPLYLKTDNGLSFRLQFDCAKCQMNVYAED